jgi:hypothetical protein
MLVVVVVENCTRCGGEIPFGRKRWETQGRNDFERAKERRPSVGLQLTPRASKTCAGASRSAVPDHRTMQQCVLSREVHVCV